jgi:membrane associated rhomboid family serine protease
MFSTRSSFLSNIPIVVKNLMAINLILWLASIALPGLLLRFGLDFDLTDVLGMHYWASEKFKLSQLITYMFMHGGFNHIFFNMFALYMFGSTLENFWGPKKFLIYYLITGVGAGIVQQLFWSIEYQPVISALNQAISDNSGELLLSYQHVLDRFFRLSDLTGFKAPDLIELKQIFMNLPVTVGASGSVFGLLLAFGWLFPDVRLMMLFIPVPIKARVFVLIYGVAELFLGVARFSGDSVAHFAHLGGMIFGIILLMIWRKKGY